MAVTRITEYQFEPEDFNPADALEFLRSHLIDVEALVDAANRILAEVPPPRERHARRTFSKLYSLLNASAATAQEAVLAGEHYVAVLANHLKPKKKRR